MEAVAHVAMKLQLAAPLHADFLPDRGPVADSEPIPRLKNRDYVRPW
jgi:hypothetical protein